MFFTRSKKYLFFFFCLAFVVFGFATIQAAPPEKSEPSKVEPHPSWTIQEKWVWNKLCKGEIADLNKYYGKKLNPKKPEEWKGSEKTRLLSPKFLEKIIFEKPYCGAIHRKGVRIIGAWIKESLDLSNGFIPFQLWFHKSLFDSEVSLRDTRAAYLISFIGSKFNGRLDMEGLNVKSPLFMGSAQFREVILNSAKIGDQLNMKGSKFNGRLDMASLEVKNHLFMSNKAEFKDVVLRSARIGGTLEIDSSRFKDKLDMEGLHVKGPLFMSSAQFREVVLRSARIGGQLDMTGSKFNGKLHMSSLKLKSHLFMSNKAEFKDVVLRGARIGGQIDMTGSRLKGKLEMDSLEIESHLFMRDAEFEGVRMSGARIGGDLQIFDSKFSNLDLTGTKINGDFNLGARFEEAPNQGKAPKWEKGAKLILLNTEVGALQDLEKSWPDAIELTGFTYSRLGGLGVNPKESMVNRKISKLKEWLEKQKHYSPQPYEQLAKVLNQTGHKDKAKEILYESKNRERRGSSGFHRFNLFLQYIFVGYGFRYVFALYWVVGFTLLGAILTGIFVMREKIKEKPKNFIYIIDCFFYSLDMLLPIIKLNESHYKIELESKVKYYFYIHQMFGYVLAYFIIAGLSGIIQK